MVLNYDKWAAIDADEAEEDEEREQRDAAHNQTMLLLGLTLADCAPQLSETASARLVRFVAVVSSNPWTSASQQRQMARTRGKRIVELLRRDGQPSLPALCALCRAAKANHDALVAGRGGEAADSKEASSRALIAAMAALNILTATHSYKGGAPYVFTSLAEADEHDEVANEMAAKLGAYQFAADALADYPERPPKSAAAPAEGEPRSRPAPLSDDEWAEAEAHEEAKASTFERNEAIERAAKAIASERKPSSAVEQRARLDKAVAETSLVRTLNRQLAMHFGVVCFGLLLGLVLRSLGVGKEARPNVPADGLLRYLGLADSREL